METKKQKVSLNTKMKPGRAITTLPKGTHLVEVGVMRALSPPVMMRGGFGRCLLLRMETRRISGWKMSRTLLCRVAAPLCGGAPNSGRGFIVPWRVSTKGRALCGSSVQIRIV
jgi:hypothetical protein